MNDAIVFEHVEEHNDIDLWHLSMKMLLFPYRLIVV